MNHADVTRWQHRQVVDRRDCPCCDRRLTKTDETRHDGILIVKHYCPHCQASGSVEHVGPKRGSDGRGCLRGEI